MSPATPNEAAPASSSGYAIVEASGQQFWLQPKRYYDLDRLNAEVGDTVSLDTVLLLHDGSTAKLGQPYVDGASVTLTVMEHRRGPKLIVYKMRPKKKTRRKNGHRQELTRVMVESISAGAKATKAG
jgi:large subunit ribosomal protein L21